MVLRYVSLLFVGLSSSLALAEGETLRHVADIAQGNNLGLVALASALAIGISAFGAASAQGKAAQGALEGITRNPTSQKAVSGPMLLSLAFMEFQALLGFVVAFLIYGLI